MSRRLLHLAAGLAMSAGGGPSVTDTAPYLFRETAGGATVGSKSYPKLVGATVAWNQLVQNGDFADGTHWGAGNYYPTTRTFSDNTATLVPISGMSVDMAQTASLQITGHKCLLCVTAKSTGTSMTIRFAGEPSQDVSITGLTDSFATINIVKSITAVSIQGIIVFATVGNDGSLELKNFQLFDLTKMFGSAIADYVYTIEQSTAGSGIAWLKSYGFFTEDYYAYDTGSLQSVNASAHKTYDANNTLLGNYALDSSLTLRGLFQLDTNKLTTDGDSYEADGTVTRKYGIVDLGTIDWIYSNTLLSVPCFYSKPIPNMTQNANMLMDEYLFISGGRTNIDGNYQFAMGNIYESYIVIRDDSKSTLTGNQFRDSMSGVPLIYELATPTTETADPFTVPQTVASGGTEEFVDAGVAAGTRDVAVSVGNETVYKSGGGGNAGLGLALALLNRRNH